MFISRCQYLMLILVVNILYKYKVFCIICKRFAIHLYFTCILNVCVNIFCTYRAPSFNIVDLNMFPFVLYSISLRKWSRIDLVSAPRVTILRLVYWPLRHYMTVYHLLAIRSHITQVNSKPFSILSKITETSVVGNNWY